MTQISLPLAQQFAGQQPICLPRIGLDGFVGESDLIEAAMTDKNKQYDAYFGVARDNLLPPDMLLKSALVQALSAVGRDLRHGHSLTPMEIGALREGAAALLEGLEFPT